MPALRSEVPGLLEFVGYAFNFQTVLVGPMVDFRHYRHFIETGLSPPVSQDTGAGKVSFSKSPSRGPDISVLDRRLPIEPIQICRVAALAVNVLISWK